MAIEPARLAAALVSIVDGSKAIRFSGKHNVKGVQRVGSLFSVFGDGPHGRWSKRYGQVVNALWDGRLAIDATMGVPLPKSWNYRLKLRVLCELNGTEFPQRSYTMILGRYGDVVQYADGTLYLSWYPTCLRGWSMNLVRPAAWEKLCRNTLERDEKKTLARRILHEAAREWIPRLAQVRPIEVSAGVICGSGDKDIDAEDSALHHRYEAGVCSWAGYHSVNTGKYTTAPLFAAQVAQRAAKHADGEFERVAG